MTLTTDARHDCGRVISYHDFIGGICPRCERLLEEAPPVAYTQPPWHEYVCTNGHRLLSAQKPERWVGRVCGAVTAPATNGRPFDRSECIGPCDSTWRLKENHHAQ